LKLTVRAFAENVPLFVQFPATLIVKKAGDVRRSRRINLNVVECPAAREGPACTRRRPWLISPGKLVTPEALLSVRLL